MKPVERSGQEMRPELFQEMRPETARNPGQELNPKKTLNSETSLFCGAIPGHKELLKSGLKFPPLALFGKYGNPAGLFGAFLLVLFLGMALTPSLFTSVNPKERFVPYEDPSSEHLLGTNHMGNDILAELVYGARLSLLVGFASGLVSTLIGLIIGLFAGYFRGTVDEVLMGFTDVVLIIPKIPLIIVLAAFLKPGVWLLVLVLGLLSWESLARVVRSRTLQLRETGFVLSARCMGFGPLHIMGSDIFPNLIHVVLPKFMLATASAMLSEASLSFLGLGASPSMKSWGSMIAAAFNKGGFIREMWWWYLPPGFCITLCIIAVVSIAFVFEAERSGLKIE